MSNQKGKKQVRPTIEVEWDEIPTKPAELPFTVLVEGAQGAGKTHFSMTFPEPIFILDTENRADVVAAKFAGYKKVYRKRVATFNELRQTLVQLVFEHESGTIVIDSGSDLQAMAELEYLEEAKVERIFPTYIWGRVWDKMDNMLKAIRERGFYCVITGRLRDEYKNDERTGYQVLEGYKKLPYRADIHLRLLGDNTAEVYKNGFRNDPIEQVKVLEAPSYSEIMDKLILAETPGPEVLEEVKPVANEKVAKAEKEKKEKAKVKAETAKKQKVEEIPEGNHKAEKRNPPQNGLKEVDLNAVATKEEIVEAYKHGLEIGLDDATLKMILFDVRGEDVADQERPSDGMTVGEIEIWKEGMKTIAEEFLTK